MVGSVCGGVESDVEEISMPTLHNLVPISPTKLPFASHCVGTFYIIILFLFYFVSVIQLSLT